MKIALSIVLGLFLLGCSSDTTKDAPATNTEAKEEKVTLEKVIEDVKKIEVINTEDAKESITKSVAAASKTIQDTTSKVVQAVTSSMPSANGKALYATCISCHGANGEKKALGKSEVIQGWEVQRTIDALNGYKDGSYGGAMKNLMKGQVTKLSADDTKAIAEYISSL